MRTSTDGCRVVNPRRRGISHSEAKPLVVVTVSCGARALRLEAVGDLLQPLEQLGGGPLQRAPMLGQHQRARAALEQRHAQMLLQRPDLPAHGRLRDQQLVGGLREGQVAGGRLEALDQVERRQVEASLMHYHGSCIG